MRELARRDEDRFMQEFFHIRTTKPGAPLELIKFNYPQQVAHALRLEDKKAGRPIREIDLKSRRVGFSTDMLLSGLAKTWAHDNWESMIIAHDKDRAKKLLVMAHIANAELPIEMQLRLERSTTEQLRFAESHSGMTIKTAANFQRASRGDGQMFGMASEAFYYDDFLAVIQAMAVLIPYVFGTFFGIESTANGAGTPGHDFWLEAVENLARLKEGKPLGKNPFRAHFHAWQDDAANMIPFKNDLHKASVMEQIFFEYPDVQARAEAFRLLPEQVHFYYTMLNSICFGDTIFMQQEWPCDPEEAFLASGTPIFPMRQLGLYFKNCREGELFSIYTKELHDRQICEVFSDFSQLKDAGDVDRSVENYIEVWTRPMPGRRYCMGLDSSAGYKTSDFCSGFVVDMDTLEMCAEVHGRIEPSDFAIVSGSLGRIYNNALIAPELEGLGHSTLSHLKLWYWHIYQQRKDKGHNLEITNQLGWSTNTTSRPVMISNTKRIFLERAKGGNDVMSRFIKSKFLIQELRTFVTGPSGKPAAAKGKFDDRCMAFFITLIAIFHELYGTVAKEDGLLPTPAYTSNNVDTLNPRMDEVMADILDGGKGWARGGVLDDVDGLFD